MRKTLICAASIAALALAACSKPADVPADTPASDAAGPVAEEAAPARAAKDSAEAVPGLAAIPVSLPQLAYAYNYHWQLPAADIGPLQRRHAALCEQQGPGVCQILGMTKTGETEGEVDGMLELAVASRQARSFGAALEDAAAAAGAKQVAAEIASEELSKQMVDTEARLRARTQLRDRLQEVLRTRKGTVEELVEAERSVAAVNEEIDQARSWLKEMQGRVAYSRITLRYDTGAAATRDFLSPVKGAVGSLGAILGYLAALLIVAGAVLAPIAGLVWGSRLLRRRLAGNDPA